MQSYKYLNLLLMRSHPPVPGDSPPCQRTTELVPWHGHVLHVRRHASPSSVEIEAVEVGSRVLELPDTLQQLPVTTCRLTQVRNGERVRHLVIPASCTLLELRNLTFPYLETLQVEPGNPVYADWDNMLLSADRTKLHLVLCHYQDGCITVPDTITQLGAYAFEDTCCTHIQFPDHALTCPEHSFDGSQFLAAQGAVAMVQNTFFRLLQRQRILTLPATTKRYTPWCLNHYTPEEIISPVLLQTGEALAVTSYTLTDPQAAIPIDSLHNYKHLAYLHLPADHATHYSLDGVVFLRDGTLCFYPRGNLQSSYTVPPSTCAIGERAFSENPYLHTLTLTPRVQSLGERAFAGCTNLQYIELAEGLVHIGAQCFQHTAIATLTLPESVQTLGLHALLDIRRVTVSEGTAQGLMQALYASRADADKYLTVRTRRLDPDRRETSSYRFLLPACLTQAGAAQLAQLWDGEQFQLSVYLSCFENHVTQTQTRQEMALLCCADLPHSLSEPFRKYLRRNNFAVSKRLIDEGRTDELAMLLRMGLVTDASAHKLLNLARDADLPAVSYLLSYVEKGRSHAHLAPL